MLHDTIAKQIPQLARRQVWCRQCGKTRRVDSAEAMRNGWPKCCGCTMTIDSPEEQKRLAKKVPNAKGQRGAACGASAAPTGCASNGNYNERTDK